MEFVYKYFVIQNIEILRRYKTEALVLLNECSNFRLVWLIMSQCMLCIEYAYQEMQ